jgi:hypothetical protein
MALDYTADYTVAYSAAHSVHTATELAKAVARVVPYFGSALFVAVVEAVVSRWSVIRLGLWRRWQLLWV